MFDRLDDLLIRYEEVMGELQEPDVANDSERFRKLMKEQSDLAPIVEAYKEYKDCRQNIEDSLAMLEEESDEEMRELAKEELSESRSRVEELERFLTLPRSKFSAEFHQAFGLPPKQYITLRRIGRAKYLLIRTQLSIKEIALESGFANEFFFSKVFKKYTNHAPSEYRTVMDCGISPF